MSTGREQDGVRYRTQLQDNKRRLLPHEEPDDPDWPYAHGNLDPLGKFIGLSIMVVSLSLVAYFRYQQYLRDIVITPLEAPCIISAKASSADVSPERFWGTYRPHTYFGLQTLSPNSPVFGAMWVQQFTNKTSPPLRHWCDPADGLHGYGWLLHDGQFFGIQELEDEDFTVRTEFVKRAGGQHGGDWTTRITMTPKNTAKEVVVSSMFYVALDGQGAVQPVFSNDVLTDVIGHTEQLGDFQLWFPVPRNNSGRTSHLITHVSSLAQLTDSVKSGMTWNARNKEGTLSYVTLGGRKMPQEASGVNFIVKEVTATLPFAMEIVFESGSFHDRPEMLTGNVFDSSLVKHVQDFDQRFSKTFQLEKKGFGETESHMAKAALSNMLGSIGYFYGSSFVQSDYNKVPVKYWKAPLFTSVPSRSFSPYGSLWDEGFHNLLISRWDESLSLDIIGHWLDLINTEGWIPQEQILGDEIHTKIEAEHATQHNKMAAPPGIFLPLQRLIPKLVSSKDPMDQLYLTALFPRLKALYGWYNSSLSRSVMSVYLRRGRNNEAAAQTDQEGHVDLHCWMALASGVMVEIAKGLNEPWQEYTATHQLLTDNAVLERLYWSEEDQQFSSSGLHADQAKLKKPSPHLHKDQSVNSETKLQFGYISLFPFLLKIVDPQSPKLYKILTDLKNPALLWSQYGLRSVAHTGSFYQHGNMESSSSSWQGDVWIDMNFLTLAALHHYSHTAGPYSQLAGNIYSELRRNLVKNVVKEFQGTGYLWESYSDRTGEGKGRYPFTGWSALVVLIMGEVY